MRVLQIISVSLFGILLLFSCTPTPPTDAGEGLGGVEATTVEAYDIYQQTFVMAMLANMSGSDTIKKGLLSIKDAEKAFEKNIRNAFNKTTQTAQMKLEGNAWEIVWGPVVFVEDTIDYKVTHDSLNLKRVISTFAAATQAMFVAKNGNDYVIAIAGTNSNSGIDLFEDMDIATKVKHERKHKKWWQKKYYNTYNKEWWPYLELDEKKPTKKESKKGIKESTLKITPGTGFAMDILFTQMSDDGKSLVSYLDTTLVGKKGVTVTITGHSLGGGLVPPVGLALFHPRTTLAGAEKLHTIAHRIYPIAAPDIGTGEFVDSLRAVFPTKNIKGYKQWNQKIWNDKDVVPRAWSKSNLTSIVNIYNDTIPNPPGLKSLIEDILYPEVDNGITNASPYITMDPSKNGQFAGTFIKPKHIKSLYDCTNCGTDTAVINTICPYFTEILYQHIPAYFEHFGIDTSVMRPPHISPCKAAEGYGAALKAIKAASKKK